jgi:hypothetical protein
VTTNGSGSGSGNGSGDGSGNGDTKTSPPEPPVKEPNAGSLDTRTQAPSSPELYNPINSNTLIGLAFKLLKFFFAGVAALAVVFVVLGGVQLTVSRGNPEALTKGKDTIIWSLIGVVVAVMAFSLVGIVQSMLGAY